MRIILFSRAVDESLNKPCKVPTHWVLGVEGVFIILVSVGVGVVVGHQ